MGRKNKTFTQAEILKAIKQSNGIISDVAKRLNCAWHTAEKNINRFQETKKAMTDENEATLDLAEKKLIEAIEKGDGAMIRYYLSTKGRRRGYSQNDTAENDTQDREPLVIRIVDENLE